MLWDSLIRLQRIFVELFIFLVCQKRMICDGLHKKRILISVFQVCFLRTKDLVDCLLVKNNVELLKDIIQLVPLDSFAKYHAALSLLLKQDKNCFEILSAV